MSNPSGTPTPSGRVGTVLSGRYRLDGLLGRGGMSTVYKATDPNLQRTVAVKIIHTHLSEDESFLSRFEREASAVARLHHPNIYQIHDFNHDNGIYYMVMEYIEGQTLENQLKALSVLGERFSLSRIITIMAKICDAVDYAHSRDMIHRDLKPSNVMINQHGDPVLMDFGVAKLMGSKSETATGSALGTAAYMSPEQAKGDTADRRSDIYSLGVILYEMVSGERPFQADSVITLMMKHVNEPVPDVRKLGREVPEPLARIIDKALAKNPNDRFPTAAAFAAALRSFKVDATQTATNVAPVGTLPSPTESVLSSRETTSSGAHRGTQSGTYSGSHGSFEGETQLATTTGSRPFTTTPEPETPKAKRPLSLPLLGGLALLIIAAIASAVYFLGGDSTSETPTDLPSAAGMVQIPGGNYRLGVPNAGANQIAPQQITVEEFWIDQYEATNASYATFATATGADPLAKWGGTTSPAGQDNLPAEGLTYDVAAAYCAYQGKRLPTEAEWEIAARGPNSLLYPWGDRENLIDLPRGSSYPVGSIVGNRSAFGIFDMAGNVWEWVSEPYAAVPEGQRVLRGGQYGLVRDAAYRLIGDPNALSIYRTAGVRCASSAVDPATLDLAADTSALNAISALDTLLFDDFSNPASGWLDGTNGNTLFGYHPPNFYHVQAGAPNTVATSFRALNEQDFTAEAEVFVDSVDAADGDFRYGLAVRAAGSDFYAFTIDPLKEEWAIEKHSGGTAEVLASGSEPTMLPAAQINQLRVDALGPQLAFSLNGHNLAHVEDDTITGDDIGFYVETFDQPRAHVHYVRLLVRKPELSPNAAVLVQDDFTDPTSGWPDGGDATSLFGYHPPDFYHVQAGAANSVATAFRTLDADNYTFEADVFVEAIDSESGDFRYGLAVRRTGENYYAFAISPQSKRWYILKNSTDGRAVIGEGESDAIHNGKDTNKLRVDVDGDTMTFRINGQAVSQLVDTAYTGRDYGFFVETFDQPRAHIHYDSFTVRTVDPPTAAVAQVREGGAVDAGTTSEGTTEAGTGETTAEVTPAPTTSGANMVQVSAGTYIVGTGNTAVPLDEFWLDAYETTNAEFSEFIEATAGTPPAYWAENDIPNTQGDHPVHGLDWDTAAAYCNWAGKRLPTEAEWEAAARGPHAYLYPWGDNANLVKLPSSNTYPVGSLLQNRSYFGAFDMAGNVWEWVDTPYTPVQSGEQVIRGGANSFQGDMTFRVAGEPSSQLMNRDAGVRCAADNVLPEMADSVLLHDNFADIGSGWWQARAPVGPYFYGYHPTDFYHMQISSSEGCLSVYRELAPDNVMVEAQIFIASTKTETGNFRYGITLRESGSNFYALMVSPRTKTWQVLKGTEDAMELMDSGTNDTIDGSSQPLRDRLFAVANGSELSFFVNGQLVSHLFDDTYPTGNFGFIISTLDEPYIHIHYDEVTVEAVPESAVPATGPTAESYPVEGLTCAGSVSSADTLVNFVAHRVEDGETMTQIAADNGITLEQLAGANGRNVSDLSVIRVGQTIIIPVTGN